jgi:hypothetical protein
MPGELPIVTGNFTNMPPATVNRPVLRPLRRFGACAAEISFLSLGGSAQAQQTMGWTLYDGGSFGKSGSATNGSVFESSSESGGGDTILGGS